MKKNMEKATYKAAIEEMKNEGIDIIYLLCEEQILLDEEDFEE